MWFGGSQQKDISAGVLLSFWEANPSSRTDSEPSFCVQNQHDDVKKQLLELQLQHNSLKLEHRKSLESQSLKFSQLQQERDSEVTNLQGG